jgi:hypothetical protein
MVFDEPSLPGEGRRLNLVEQSDSPLAAGSELQKPAEDLAEFVWSLAPGDACFACGQGRLRPQSGSPGEQERPGEQPPAGPLVCPVCGAEAGALEAA